MSRYCTLNNNFPNDNNVLVLDMVLSSLWSVPQPINWDNVAMLVPGFTPKECAQRFEELKSTGGSHHVDDQCNALTAGGSSPVDSLSTYIKSTLLDTTGDVGETRTNQSSISVTGLAVNPSRGSSVEKESRESAEEDEKPQEGKGPNMVIHVCDEAKNLKQDFMCPRDLLINEMRYFAEYLSVDPQRWEEVDISVHCDVQIFDWLMNYVKRHKMAVDGNNDKPKLEPSNVISILISSEFLKMDTLVEECIQYCHKHMSAIVATPCNMNCINSNLAADISDLFSHNEADDIMDRKDKFKSKLFQKKIECLFDPDYKNQDSPGNASTLYRCGLCLKLLTKDTERKISCIPGKININPRGDLTYTHSRQKRWEVHDYMTGLYEELKSWVLVYWRIWGTINHLTCSHCQQVGRGGAVYHLTCSHCQQVGGGGGGGAVNHLTCSHCQQVGRGVGGCQTPHLLPLPTGREGGGLLNDLLLHRETVCVPNTPLPETGHQTDLGPGYLNPDMPSSALCQRQQTLLSEDEEYTTGSEVTEDEVGDEEEASKKQAAKKARKLSKPLKRQMSSPNFHRKDKAVDKVSVLHSVSAQKSKWDSSRSIRYNQDAQREEDQRRMVEIIGHLTKIRFGDQEQRKSKDTKEVCFTESITPLSITPLSITPLSITPLFITPLFITPLFITPFFCRG
uniref:SANT and BTB domain regulator of CSR n=1 Tax=Salmo trutta TaxID=8032 RepID=A0A673ZX07_SALTR